jgi:putative flippase GtrA
MMMKRDWIPQFGRYALVGVGGAFINIGVTTVLLALCHCHSYWMVPFLQLQIDLLVTVFNGIGILIAFLFNFYFNKTWTFREDQSRNEIYY